MVSRGVTAGTGPRVEACLQALRMCIGRKSTLHKAVSSAPALLVVNDFLPARPQQALESDSESLVGKS